ncbi:MAG: sulfatase [Holdemania filiformis]
MQPNVIMILIDDLGWMDLSCQGSSFYETPHIDQLRREGMAFDQAYAACPVCSPSRASILSGKYPARLKVTDWIDHENYHPCRGKLIDAPYIKELSVSEFSMAKAFQEAGYQTWHVGKWHLGKEATYPEHHGFDVNLGGSWWGHPKKGYFSPYHMENLSDGPEGEYLTDRISAGGRTDPQPRHQRPFFLNLWHYAVHTPPAKAEDIAYFEEKAKRMGLDQQDPFEIGDPFPILQKKDKRITRRIVQSDPVYAAMIKALDDSVGQLMATLKAEGLDEDTIVIFTSDNGGLATAEHSPTCNFPLSEGKGWMYEGAVREPLFVRWPGKIEAGSLSHALTTSPDFYPTLLELCGLPLRPQQHCDGVSLAPVLLNPQAKFDRGPIFWHYPHYGNQGGTPGSALRCGKWKYIEFYEDHSVRLFDLEQDVSEKHNVAEVYPDLVRQFHSLLHEWLEAVDAWYPEVNPHAEQDMA